MWRIHGLTSHKVQRLLNQLCSCGQSYLEVGSYLGATAAAALAGNKLNAYFVDNWEEDPQPFRDDLPRLPPTSKEEFIKNIKQYKGESKVKVFDADMFDVDLDQIEPIDIFFYDGPHGARETFQAIQYYAPVLANQAIVVVDDANFDGTVKGTKEALKAAGLTIHYERIILEDEPGENADGWWNGVYILGVSR
jgi:hypothetical protein